jgi:hypothetical protein
MISASYTYIMTTDTNVLPNTRKGKNLRSIPINVSISNVPPTNPEKGKPTKSLYNRLCVYSGDKGLSEQDIIRFALSMYLDKVGY